jgi:hypothetical protein
MPTENPNDLDLGADPDDDMFPMPEAKNPAGVEPGGVSLGGWPEVPGSPLFPILVDSAPFHGYVAGGMIKHCLCAPNQNTGAVGCYHYNAGMDQCGGPMPEVLRVQAVACINYKARG